MKQTKENLLRVKNNKAITLIALVITIIVLLILAGVTIVTLTGDNGLLQKAGEAKNATIEAEGLERIKLAVMASHDENGINTTSLAKNLSKINNITDANNQTITENTEISLPMLVTVEKNEFIITEDGLVREPYVTYTLGTEVVVGEEHFFVITEDDNKINKEISLISKYNLNKIIGTDGNYTQINAKNAETACKFSNKSYWSDIEGITYRYNLNNIISEDATTINIAKKYGMNKGGKGRLLTYEEAVNLKTKIPDIILGKNYIVNPVENDNYLYYWLGSAYNDSKVCILYGGNSLIYNYNVGNSNNGGVRPVLEISKEYIIN